VHPIIVANTKQKYKIIATIFTRDGSKGLDGNVDNNKFEAENNFYILIY